jgi:hypothetical protein
MTDAEWLAILHYAQVLQPLPGAISAPNDIKGRFIRQLVDRLVAFWGRHQATLIPFLTQAAIAALNALVAAQSGIDAINPPGPE